MLAYEVEYEGQKYFGNIPLHEFHLFQMEGQFILFDVERVLARSITPTEFLELQHLPTWPGDLLPAPIMNRLRQLGLVEDDTDPEDLSTGDALSAGVAQRTSPICVSNITLFVAQTCNLNCVYCYGNGGSYHEGKAIMNDETAFRAVDWLFENSAGVDKLRISFFGGEPLLNFPLITRVVNYAKDQAAKIGKKMSFGVTTNATVLTDDMLAFLANEKIGVLVSFDGPPEVHNRQRPFKDGSGSYDTVRYNITKLLAAYPKLQGRATLCGSADPLEVEAAMRQAGFTTCMLTNMSPSLFSMRTPKPGLGIVDDTTAQRTIAFLRTKAHDLMHSAKQRIAEDNKLAGLMMLLVTNKKRYYGCGVGKGTLAVSVRGDIYPCHRFAGQPDWIMGNINCYRAGEPNKYHLATVDTLPTCCACWARYFCGGGCAYENIVRTGDARTPDASFCTVMTTAIEIGIWTYCQMDDSDREFLRSTYTGSSLRLP